MSIVHKISEPNPKMPEVIIVKNRGNTLANGYLEFLLQVVDYPFVSAGEVSIPPPLCLAPVLHRIWEEELPA